MKIPYFAGESLSEFLKSAQAAKEVEAEDGGLMTAYGTNVAAPEACLQSNCGLKKKLLRNGSYCRIVIDGLVLILVLIYRFRCRGCGRTVSRPYSFLSPYRRFPADLICDAIEMYGAGKETSYREISAELSVGNPKTLEEEVDQAVLEKNGVVHGKSGLCPAHSTVFSWVDRLCKKDEQNVLQVEKELVRRSVDLDSLEAVRQVVNLNSWKAGKERYKAQKDKPEQLNKLSYLLAAGKLLIVCPKATRRLRSYFLCLAEKCLDLLSDVVLKFPITQTPERLVWQASLDLRCSVAWNSCKRWKTTKRSGESGQSLDSE